MDEVTTVSIDLAKSVFQVHGADQSGVVVVRKKLAKLLILIREIRTRFSVDPSSPLIIRQKPCQPDSEI